MTNSPLAPPVTTGAGRTIVPVPSSVQRIPGQPPVVHYGTIDSPDIGVAYEYHLYVHCGVRAARFGGRWWQAVSPSDERHTDGGPGYLAGSMTLVQPDLARFAWAGCSADFTPAPIEPTPCA
jgi:hypothetical protein